MNAPPPKISAANTWAAVAILLAAAAGAAAMLFFFNPAQYNIYPVCQFHRLTGLNCPGCGMTRALYALLHGQFALALRDNALLVAGLIFCALRGGWWAVRKALGKPVGHFFPPKLLWPLLGVVLVFGVLRNLPAFAFLSP
jgi:Protein of unknown function (DUF2752)